MAASQVSGAFIPFSGVAQCPRQHLVGGLVSAILMGRGNSLWFQVVFLRSVVVPNAFCGLTSSVRLFEVPAFSAFFQIGLLFLPR